MAEILSRGCLQEIMTRLSAEYLVRRSCANLSASLKRWMHVLFSLACKRRVCGDAREGLVGRRWISRSSAVVFLFGKMFVREKTAEVRNEVLISRTWISRFLLFFFFF